MSRQFPASAQVKGPIIPAQAGIHAATIKLALSNSTPIGSPVLRVNGRWKMVKATPILDKMKRSL